MGIIVLFAGASAVFVELRDATGVVPLGAAHHRHEEAAPVERVELVRDGG